ncbi:MAG: ThuA domain-containing protein [Lentisphaeraceae bacterium]|nr:ThuA domain-containing protein [Lentisphaeraceae bacterium]
MKYLFCNLFLFSCIFTGQAEQLDVLFLGHDSKHHNSRLNHKKLIPEFLRQGINLTYTEDIGILSDEALAKYDVLILYANYKSWSSSQEKALMDFVEEGKGFFPLHCASWCFHDSEEFTKLVGARFSRHGKGWFTANWIKGKEIEGVDEFLTKDETYIHKDFNPDRTDLQVRVEGKHKEPWTWTRKQGKGRVFYTAYGHDGPIWENAEFHKLVSSGVIWASGKEGIKAKVNYPVFKYKEDKGGFLTNYEKRRFRHKLQLPVSPEESAKCNVLPEGFEAVLFASEPDIVNPIDMCWDDRGRLFVAETLDYPNDMQKYGKGNDRIKICEDTNGDDKADKFTIFAEGLSIPTSICFANGGVIVAHAPEFLFIKDTDGDDKADEVKTISRGWGTRDTHAGPANLQYGLDNKIYGSIGYSGGPAKVKNGLFRMNLDGSNLENISNFNNNTWGLGISEDFEIFGSTANRNPAFHVAIPYPFYGKAKVKKKGAARMFDNAEFYPLLATRQVDCFDQYTAAAGFNLYTARSFPEKYWNSSAFLGGPSGRLLGQFFIESDGASYKAKNGDSILASFDQYTSPIQAKTGPDGNLWMLDWSNLIIQHNPIPTVARGGFKSKKGKGNAHWNPLRDKKHGRVYKIRHVGSQENKVLDLSQATTKQLVEALKSKNMFWRQTAQMKLIASKDLEAVPFLVEILKDQDVDVKGLNTSVIHALWTLKGLDAIGSSSSVFTQVEKCLTHPSAGVRKNTVRVLPQVEKSAVSIIESGILQDEDLSVQRMAFLSASTLPTSIVLGQELSKLQKNTEGDTWLHESWKIASAVHLGLEKISTSEQKPFKVEILKGRPVQGKKLTALCFGCHGANLDGDAARRSPSLAGQNSWYTISQLQKYKAEMRGDATDANAVTMQAIAKTLSSQQMADISEYLQQKVKPENKLVTLKGNVENGAKVYQSCIPCHGSNGKGLSQFLSPNLTVLSDWYILESLQKFKSGERGSHKADTYGILMKAAVTNLTEQQQKDVTVYIKSLQNK